MDKIVALILLIFLSPFLLVCFFLVKLTSKGPFIFKQLRTGKERQPFFLYKIRTMSENAEKEKIKYSKLNQADGPVFKIYNDPRLTRVGKILSRTGLDETLQLVNVIKGDMTFVGPRPLPVAETQKIPKKYYKRFSVKPGLTSLWIIRGAHGLTFTQWMESDLEYVEKKNISLDMYIIAVTVSLIFHWIYKEIKLLFGFSSSVL